MQRSFRPELLASRRRRMGMTQAALSQAANISQVSISAIERGRKEPRSGTLARLANALDCGVECFFKD